VNTQHTDEEDAIGTGKSVSAKDVSEEGASVAENPATSNYTASNPPARQSAESPQSELQPKTTEHGGPKGLEPTRYGDWEQNGRCTDF